jgi:hypothetical protein
VLLESVDDYVEFELDKLRTVGAGGFGKVQVGVVNGVSIAVKHHHQREHDALQREAKLLAEV